MSGRAFEPGAGPWPCGALADGAICTPPEDEAGGAATVVLPGTGLFADGAGVTGALEVVVPGCCANNLCGAASASLFSSIGK